MAGSPHSRRERLGTVLVAALLALSVVAGTTGVGTAHEGTDHVERNGNQIEITLGDQHNVTKASEVEVTVDGVGSETVPSSDGNETGTFTVSLSKLSQPKTNLGAATVQVSANGTELFNETVNLRSLTFVDDPDAATLANDRTLQVPLSGALGYANGTEVTATLDNDEVTGTVEYAGNQSYLAVSLTENHVTAASDDLVPITVEGQDSVDVNLRGAVENATDVNVDDETLQVNNSLFTPGSSYDVVVRTANPDGRYANATAANASRVLEVTNRLFASAESVAVSVYADGSPLVENVSDSSRSETTLNATVTDDGRAVNITNSSLDANATVWLTNATDGEDDGTYVDASVPVEDGTVNLSSTDYRLNENASYRLIVAADPAVRATVPGNESANDSDIDSLFFAAGDGGGQGGDGGDSGESSSGLLGLDSGLLVAGAALLGFGLVAVIAIVTLRKQNGGSSSAPDPDEVDSAAMASAHDSGHEVDFRVEDAATGSTVSAVLQARQRSHRTPGQNGEKTELPNGTGSMTLDRGRWIVQAGSHGVKSGEQEVNPQQRRRPVEFELGPKQVDVTVADDDGEPVANAPVTCAPDQGRSRNDSTDRDGSVTFDVPLAADEVEVSADPEGYDGDAATASVAGGSDASATLDVEPLEGDLDVTATVGGTPVAGLSVEVRPRGDDAADRGASGRTATTDDDGVAGFEGLPVGEYGIEMGVPGGASAFSTESDSVRVRDGRTGRASLDASFEFSLARNQRDRIASVRQDVDELVSTSGGDAAIPRYYGSVVTELLDAVERLPREGHRFARADAAPDAVADALLDAAESSVELVSDAMTTKRNTDLFGTCADMPDQRVEWGGGYDVETLFELLDADRKDQRQTVLTQLRGVDDRINDERSDLAVVAPARAVWDGVKAFVNEERGDDPVRGAAVAFAAGGLLDAVDELFDHDQLRERLQRTVF